MKLEDKESLIIHIEGLQATLAKRNARIAELEAQIAELKDNPLARMSEDKAFKEGWKACAGHMMELTRATAVELGKVRKEAFRYYIQEAESSK